MINSVLNILSLGTKPMYDKHLMFHKLILEFRNKLVDNTKRSLTEEDIGDFYTRLNNFNFKALLFKDYYRKYVENLNRFRPEVGDRDMDLSLLEIALAENRWKPTKPLNIFTHHIKYKYKLTSKPFISHQKKQQLKKLNAPGMTAKKHNNPHSTEKWTRVPILRNQPEDCKTTNCCHNKSGQ